MSIRLACVVLLAALSFLFITVGCTAARHNIAQSKLKVASTTSLCDSGLWEYLEPLFEERNGIDLQVLCTGSGVAVRYAEKGDVDAIVTHDPEREEQFVSKGCGLARTPFACNRFLIIGPENDPAGIRGLKAEEAFARLATYGSAIFVSRGDESGTHAKEKEMWQRVGVNYEKIRKSQWYMETGAGMGSTLQLASEKKGYTLADRATFLTFSRELDIVPLVDDDEAMLNVYSIIIVSPERCPGVNYQGAKLLANFLVSGDVQTLLRGYRVQPYGEPLFLPYCDCKQRLSSRAAYCSTLMLERWKN